MTTKITITKNGNYRIEGEEIELFDSDGNKYDLGSRTTIALCRCGHSSNKPFCDDSHKTCNFDSVAAPYKLKPKK